MKIVEMLSETAFKKQPFMGTFHLINNKYALVSKGRVGNSPAGLTRIGYDIYQTEGLQSDPTQLGKMELFIDDSSQEIEGIVNIELSSQGTGLGRDIISDLIDTVGQQIKVYDIKSDAQGFWEKMGVEYTDSSKKYGVISK